MRIPPNYEGMIRDIATAAGKHGFFFDHDTLADYPPELPERGHTFEAVIYLTRYAGDFPEDAPKLISHENSSCRTGK